jgi:FKBP-type peptidyl-prolyl cis-trans isomerase
MRRCALLWAFFICSKCVCAQFEGYARHEGYYSRLLSFSDDTLQLAHADLAILKIGFAAIKEGHVDSISFDEIVLNGRQLRETCEDSSLSIDSMFSAHLAMMTPGEGQSFIIPYRMVASSVLDHFGEKQLNPFDWIRIDIHFITGHTVDKLPLLLMQACQQHEILETEAIDRLRLASGCEQMYRKWDIGLRWLEHGDGQLISAGKSIQIRYTTHLFDGTSIDEPTNMEFTFGRPGQVVDGMQYALSFMRAGDHVQAFIPSHLAFGVDGIKNQVIPRNTPLIFLVKILSVE